MKIPRAAGAIFALLFFPPAIAAALDPPPPTEMVDRASEDLFRARGVRGAFVLYDVAGGRRIVVDPDEAGRRHVPCSTFKIPNTLIGLETGVIPDEKFALRWDGQTREVADWNRDHDLASAIRFSVVWFFQEVARRIGEQRMRDWVARLGYGNQTIGAAGATAIDRFWLDGPLQISPREQVDFLTRLFSGNAPVSAAHLALLARLILLEQTPDHALRGKTGLGFEAAQSLGWLVGTVEKSGRRWIFATLLLAPSAEVKRLIPLRLEITRALLARHGAW